MKLVHPELSKQIDFEMANAYEWVIESPKLFSNYIQELMRQIEGEEGRFILSHKVKELDIGKNIEIIINPLGIDLNDKRILKKLYTDLLQLANNDFFLKTQEMKGMLHTYFYQLEQNYNLPLEIDVDIDSIAVIKALNVKIADYGENMFEKLSQYMKVMAEVLSKKVIVFVNLRSYISKNQLEELIRMAQYNEICLLLIENIQRDFSNSCNYYIIDEDECDVY